MLLALEGSNAVSGGDIMAQILPAFLLVIGAPLGIWWWLRRNRTASLTRRFCILVMMAMVERHRYANN